MKSKFLVLSLLATALSMGTVSAKELSISKGKASAKSIPYYTASGNAPFVLQGPASEFSRLSFPEFRHKNTHKIKAQDDGTVFKLAPGSYQITFTGTFFAPSGERISHINLGVQVGDKVFAVQQKSIESNFDNYQIVATSQIFKFDEETKVSIVAKNISTGQITQVLQRSVSFLKVD